MIAESYPEQCMINGQSFFNEEQITPVNGSDYIGLTERQALDKAKSSDEVGRVVERNGEQMEITLDFMLGRLNFYIRDDVVYRVVIEGDNN